MPKAYFILFNNLNALTLIPASTPTPTTTTTSLSQNDQHLAFVPYTDISDLLSSVDFDDEKVIAEYDSLKERAPVVLFLGVDEELELADVEGGKVFEFEGGYKGQPYFAVDVTEAMKEGKVPSKVLCGAGSDVISDNEGVTREWLKAGLKLGFVPREGGFFFFFFFFPLFWS